MLHLLILTSLSVVLGDDVDACKALSNNTERLACYDQLHSYVASAPVVQSDWTVEIDQSPLDDSQTVSMYVRSTEIHRNMFGQGNRLQLTLRCKEGKTAAFIWFADEFMASNTGGSHISLDYRIDDLPAQTVSVTPSTNNKAIGFWNQRQAKPFIESLFDHNSLYVRSTPFNGNQVGATFNIAGVRETITPLRSACNW